MKEEREGERERASASEENSEQPEPKNVKTIRHFDIFSLLSVSLACYSLISLLSRRVETMKTRTV